jgi:methanogenic corrinoid protein MtbC1
MDDQEIQTAVEQVGLSNNKDSKVNYYLNNFIISAINFDEYKFNRLFIKALNEFDFIVFYKVIILPLLQRVGLLWLTNKMSPSQEHFLSELIKQKLYTLIDRTAVSNSAKEKWLLFLPENEFHEIGLLFAKYILSLKEYNVLYLGDNLPIDTLKGVAEKHKVDNILLFLLANYSINMSENHLEKLSNIFPQAKIFVVNSNKKLNIPKNKISNITLIHDLDAFIEILDSSN